MPLTQKRAKEDAAVYAGLVLADKILFRQHFFADQFTHPLSVEQKLMMCDESRRILFCTGRKLAKTLDLEAEVLQDGIMNTMRTEGVDEALFFTPNDVHMIPFVDRVFSRIDRNPILRGSVIDKRRGDNTIIEFYTGLRWYFRIEGISGKDTNVVGLRAKKIVGDEQAFGQPTVYKSLIQTALPDATWKLAGVPNGVRQTTFYQLDQTDLGKNWSRHKYSTFINPLYQSPEAKAQLIEAYGGENTHGYKTQVLGDWGDEMFTSFPEGSIAVGEQVYIHRELIALNQPQDMATLPIKFATPTKRCAMFAIGLDYGFSPDPSELIGAYCDNEDGIEWFDYFRIHMERVPQPFQVDIIRYAIRNIFIGRFIGFGSDHLATVQQLQALDSDRHFLYHHSSPGSSTPFDVEDLIKKEPNVYMVLSEKERKKPTINIPNKFLWTERFRGWMINAVTPLEGRKFWIGNDSEGINELSATTEKKTQSGHTVYYGPPDPDDSSRMVDHYRDAHLYLVDAIHQGLEKGEVEFLESELIAQMGWAGEAPEKEWTAPWD